MPLIQVLLPVFNQEASCGQALRSICDQTLRELEITVVDDGSSDGSAERLVQAAQGDERVQVVRRSHQGLVDALNHGLSLSRAPFVARMDGDDLSAPERLARQLEGLVAEPALGAVDCRVRLAESGATGPGMRSYIDWLNGLAGWSELRLALLEESPLVHPAVLMRRSALAAAGGYREDGRPEDYSLWLRMVATGWQLGKVSQTLFTWSDLPGRLTRTDPRYSRRRMAELKVELLPQLHPGLARGVQLWGAGPTGRRYLPLLLRAGIPVRRVLDIDPDKIGHQRHGLPVCPVADLHRFEELVLVALGTREAKAAARQHLEQLGRRPWEDYLLIS